jgi:hypothetical protein
VKTTLPLIARIKMLFAGQQAGNRNLTLHNSPAYEPDLRRPVKQRKSRSIPGNLTLVPKEMGAALTASKKADQSWLTHQKKTGPIEQTHSNLG